MAYRCWPMVTSSAGMIASVSGIMNVNVEPSPSTVLTLTLPPMRSMLVRTTSMPTPRPDTSVTLAAVEKPGAKIRSRISRSVIRARTSSGWMFFSIALARILLTSMPRPSSLIWMTTWPFSWLAFSDRVPSARLPAAMRSSGDSMPWSTALRTQCVSGSLIASTTLLSSSVSSPSSTSAT